MNGHRGSITPLIATIGIIIAIVFVIAIGYVLIQPLVGSQEQFIAKEWALTIDTAQAAPEDLTTELRLPQVANTLGAAYVKPLDSPVSCIGSLALDPAKALGCAVLPLTCIPEPPTIESGKLKVKILGTTYTLACQSFTENKVDIASALRFKSAELKKTYNETTRSNSITFK